MGGQTAICRRPPLVSPESALRNSVHHQLVQITSLAPQEPYHAHESAGIQVVWPDFLQRKIASPLSSMNSGDSTRLSPFNSNIPNNSPSLTLSVYTLQTCPESINRKALNFKQEQSRTHLNNQTDFSIWFRTRNSTYNISKRREKHVLQHGIIKSIK